MEPITKIEVRDLKLIDVDINELINLQPESYKELASDNYAKLRDSIIRKKFSFPLFVWVDTDGKKYITDGHQRVRAVKQMAAEGIQIPLLHAVQIDAANRVEAKELLLLSDSNYGKRTREGFDEFIDEPGFAVSDDISDLLVMPDMEYFEQAKEKENKEAKETKGTTCPSCGFHYNL